MTFPSRPTSNKPGAFYSCIGYGLMIPVAALIAAVEGYALWLAAKWWGPDLHLPTLPYGHACAVVVVVGCLTANPMAATVEDPKEVARRIFMPPIGFVCAVALLGLVVR